MLHRLINQHSRSFILLIQRSVTFRSDIAVANEMKLLNQDRKFEKALELFDTYKVNDTKALSDMVIRQALKACAHLGDLQRGIVIHDLASSSIKTDQYILPSLIHLYSEFAHLLTSHVCVILVQCGDVPTAKSLFDDATKKNLIMYGAMMKGYIKNNMTMQSIDLFHQIKNPDDVIFILLFNACAQLESNEALQLTKSVLSKMPKSSLSNSRLVTSLVDALMKCGDVKAAEEVFNKSTIKDVSMYGAMMKGYIKNNLVNKAVDLYHQIKNPDDVIFILLFNACAQLESNEALHLTKFVLSKMPKSSLSNNRLVSSLLDALAKCGDVKAAEELFHASTIKGVSMYGAMMAGYVKNDMATKAINLFHQIKKPNDIIFILLFNACGQLETSESLDLVKKVLSKMPRTFHSNTSLLTSLLGALMKCGDVKTAEEVFNKSTIKDVSMYGAMMKGYIKNNLVNKAIDLYHQIKNPDDVIFILLFNACAQLESNEALHLTKSALSKIPKSLFSNSRLITSLLDALTKCGDVKAAEEVFNESTMKDISMYGAMMTGYVKNDMATKAINLFHQIEKPNDIILILLFNACGQLETSESLDLMKKVLSKMPRTFYSNTSLLTSLLGALMKCGDVKTAEKMFNESKIKDISMYGAMMKGNTDRRLEKNALHYFYSAYAKNDMFHKTIELFNEVKNKGLLQENNGETTWNSSKEINVGHTESSLSIYLAAIKASARIHDLSWPELMMKKLPLPLLNHPQMQNALVDMWGKIGHIDKAKEIFENILELDHVGYTIMINSYGLNGMGLQAVELYHQMPKQFRAESTFICVLNACSHSGLVDEARSIFKDIPIKTERIYTTMIDCLSRASLFQEAQQLIDEYEEQHSPAPAMYIALLSGARNDKNSQLAQLIFDRMRKVFPDFTSSWMSASVLLANTYASSGNIAKATDIKIKLNHSGVKKQAGLSWTTVNGQFFQFRAHDRSHPRSSEIYGELERISKELIEHGHQYDGSWITRPVGPDETIASTLCGHSERLAIAWNFVENPNATKIQVAKNLRVCGDCHRATKLIAAIRQCEIIVRDANRIHHFHVNGQCSCNDYF